MSENELNKYQMRMQGKEPITNQEDELEDVKKPESEEDPESEE
jgi:hypothetical protein